MAALGYRYEEAMQLPVWLFWELADSYKKQAIRQKADVMQAVGMAFGNYEKPVAKAMQKEWNNDLRKGYKKQPAPELTLDQRQEKWERIAKKVL